MAERVLSNEYKALSKERWVNIELDNDDLLKWDVALMVLNPDSLYHGGYFKAKMTFPSNYPYSPPAFQFSRPLFHPNIYQDGKLCISILHAPGDDEMSGELASERWTPAQRVETVLLSIISLLDDGEINSPANVDAGVMLRDSPKEYEKRVAEDVEASKADLPAGFIIPSGDTATKAQAMKDDDGDFWVDSDAELDFGGSDTDEGDIEEDAEMEEDEEDDEDEMDSDKD